MKVWIHFFSCLITNSQYSIHYYDYGSKSGHYNNSKNCKIFFIFPQFLPYLMIFPSSAAHLVLTHLHFEKSSNTAKSLEKIKKNLSIILLLKWPLLKQKMFTVPYIIILFFKNNIFTFFCSINI